MSVLTEHDARTKWCPFARVALHAGDGGASANRHPSDGSTSPSFRPVIEEETRCIGSRCMAWRWHSPAPDPEKFSRESRSWPIWSVDGDVSFAAAAQQPIPPRPADVPVDWEEVLITGDDWDNADGGEWREPAEHAQARYQAARDERVGFCGLASKPAVQP